MNKHAALLLAISLALLLSPTLSATVTFNTTYLAACQPPSGCAFDNSSIWLGNVIPTSNDDVVIRGMPTSLPLIYTTPATQFRSLSVGYAAFIHGSINLLQAYSIVVGYGSNFTAQTSTKLVIGAMLRIEGGTFTLEQGASVVGAENATMLQFGGSSLVLRGGKLLWSGNCSYNGFLSADSMSSIFCYNATYSPSTSNLGIAPNFSLLTLPPGLIYIFPYGLVCDLLNVSQYATVFVYNIFNGTATIAQGASLRLTNIRPEKNQLSPIGLSGDGSAIISASFLNITAASPSQGVLKGSMIVGGTSVLYMANLSIWHLVCMETQSGVKLDVTIYGDNVQIGHAGKNSLIYGTLHAVGQGGITLLDNMLIFGQVTASNSLLYINTFSIASVGDPWQIWNSSRIILAGNLATSTYIDVDSTSSLIVAAPEIYIKGSVVNRGQVNVASDRVLIVEGSFTQTDSGTLSIDVVGNTVGLQLSRGTLFLNGTVEYNIATMPFMHSQKYEIAEVSVLGPSFAEARPHDDSAIHRASLESNKEIGKWRVFIVYTYKASDLPAWVWVLFVACVFEIALVVGVVVTRYRRRVFQHPIINFFYAARIVNIWRILDLEPSARA